MTRHHNWVRVRQHRPNLFARIFPPRTPQPTTWDVEVLCVFVPDGGRTHVEWIRFATSTDRIDALNRAHRFARRNSESLNKQDQPPWWS